jgi:hypothetical protein
VLPYDHTTCSSNTDKMIGPAGLLPNDRLATWLLHKFSCGYQFFFPNKVGLDLSHQLLCTIVIYRKSMDLDQFFMTNVPASNFKINSCWKFNLIMANGHTSLRAQIMFWRMGIEQIRQCNVTMPFMMKV